MPKIVAPNDFEAAKLHLDRFWHEIFWRRENEQKVTVWSIGVFWGVLTLTYGVNFDLTCVQKLILASFPLLLGVVACWYLHENWRKNKEIARLIVKLNESLGAWEPNYLVSNGTLYPEKWKYWGRDHFRKDKVSRTYLLCVILAGVLSFIGTMLR
jgi:hypothetical protein